MYIHDISDIGIDLLKMVNFLKLEGPQGWFGSEIAYVAAVILWIYYRMYELPFRILYAVMVLSYRVCAPLPRVYDGILGIFPPDLPLLTEASFLLIVLLGLHLYWFYLLARVGYRILTESAAQASREEYEGESDVEDVALQDSTSAVCSSLAAPSMCGLVSSTVSDSGSGAPCAEAELPKKERSAAALTRSKRK